MLLIINDAPISINAVLDDIEISLLSILNDPFQFPNKQNYHKHQIYLNMYQFHLPDHQIGYILYSHTL